MKICAVCRRCYDDATDRCRDDDHPQLTLLREGDLSLIEGYRLESLLETEPAGHAFRARQIASGKECRIRLLSLSVGESEKFVNEARTAMGLYHPNVADIYDAGTVDGGDVFVVSELSTDRTARDLLTDVGPPELLTSIAIVRQVAEALHAMHRAGLRHGGIAPENILLSRSNHGVTARIQNPDLAAATRHAVLSNKFLIDSYLNLLRYYSPEECSGENGDVTSDVYSLGIVFYELLTGKPPFRATKAVGLMEQHRNQTARAVEVDRYELRMLVTHAVGEALQKRPYARQSTAARCATSSSLPPITRRLRQRVRYGPQLDRRSCLLSGRRSHVPRL